MFLFFGELKKGPGVGWFVIWWFGLFWVCFFFQPTTHRDCRSIRWMRCVSFFSRSAGLWEEVFFHLGFPGSFQGIPRTPEALNEPLMSPLPRAVLRGAPWLELFTKGLGPNKYPRDIRCIWGWLLRVPSQGYIYIFLFGCFHYHKRVQ